MSHVLLIRPGCTDFDEQQRIQGNLDLPLNARGQEQVQCAVAELAHIPIDVIYSSPSEPARSCAARLGERWGVPVKELDGLQNLNHGLWQGLPIEEIRRKHPKVFKQWQESPETVCPPEGELVNDAVERVRKALEKVLKKPRNVALVAPEPVASLVRCLVRGCPVEGMALFTGANCSRLWEYLIQNGQIPEDGRFHQPGAALVNAAAAPVSILVPKGSAP